MDVEGEVGVVVEVKEAMVLRGEVEVEALAHSSSTMDQTLRYRLKDLQDGFQQQ